MAIPSETKQNVVISSKEIDEIGGFRRVLPQILAVSANNFLICVLGEFLAFPSIVIPSLIGINNELNPDETVSATAAETSWLSCYAQLAHPIGSFLSGLICYKIGRRQTIMLISIPIGVAWILFGFAESFSLICFGFFLFGLCMGLKEAPATTYISEISEPKLRGILSATIVISINVGFFIVFGFGAIFPWRKVAFICAISPFCNFLAIFFIPESPMWLLSKNRPEDAKKSLQWLRGWVSPQAIDKEFIELQNFNYLSGACSDCSKQSIKCCHSTSTFCDNIKELKSKRNLKPFILCFGLHLFQQFSLVFVWHPYIIQVINVLGIQLNAGLVTVMLSICGILASIFLLLTVKKFGRRKIYLTSTAILIFCSVALSIYGYVFLPSGWISFKKCHSHDLEHVQNMVGNWSYLALALIFVMSFISRYSIACIPAITATEVYSLKSRPFLCGITASIQSILAAISTKTYYTIETTLSLPGACLFYGTITFIGFIVMYFIMPETEQRSLEDIELHYSDNKKGITDIYIRKLTI